MDEGTLKERCEVCHKPHPLPGQDHEEKTVRIAVGPSNTSEIPWWHEECFPGRDEMLENYPE